MHTRHICKYTLCPLELLTIDNCNGIVSKNHCVKKFYRMLYVEYVEIHSYAGESSSAFGCNITWWLQRLRFSIFAFKAFFRRFVFVVANSLPRSPILLPTPWQVSCSLPTFLFNSTTWKHSFHVHGRSKTSPTHAARCSYRLFDAAVEIRFQRNESYRGEETRKKQPKTDAFGLIKIALLKIRKFPRKVFHIQNVDRQKSPAHSFMTGKHMQNIFFRGMLAVVPSRIY